MSKMATEPVQIRYILTASDYAKPNCKSRRCMVIEHNMPFEDQIKDSDRGECFVPVKWIQTVAGANAF